MKGLRRFPRSWTGEWFGKRKEGQRNRRESDADWEMGKGFFVFRPKSSSPKFVASYLYAWTGSRRSRMGSAWMDFPTSPGQAAGRKGFVDPGHAARRSLKRSTSAGVVSLNAKYIFQCKQKMAGEGR
jgi:hypothetical protein